MTVIAFSDFTDSSSIYRTSTFLILKYLSACITSNSHVDLGEFLYVTYLQPDKTVISIELQHENL